MSTSVDAQRKSVRIDRRGDCRTIDGDREVDEVVSVRIGQDKIRFLRRCRIDRRQREGDEVGDGVIGAIAEMIGDADLIASDVEVLGEEIDLLIADEVQAAGAERGGRVVGEGGGRKKGERSQKCLEKRQFAENYGCVFHFSRYPSIFDSGIILSETAAPNRL